MSKCDEKNQNDRSQNLSYSYLVMLRSWISYPTYQKHVLTEDEWCSHVSVLKVV